jgi:hypothetical protein
MISMSESSQHLPTYCDAFLCMRALSTPFSRLSACSRTRAFAHFHALTHFAPDHTQTAYHGSHIRVFSVPSHIMQCIPTHARLARLSRAHQHVPTLAHLRVFMHSCVFAHSHTFALDRTQLHYCQNAHASYPCCQLHSRFSPDAL